jgi:hypothetical protein
VLRLPGTSKVVMVPSSRAHEALYRVAGGFELSSNDACFVDRIAVGISGARRIERCKSLVSREQETVVDETRVDIRPGDCARIVNRAEDSAASAWRIKASDDTVGRADVTVKDVARVHVRSHDHARSID